MKSPDRFAPLLTRQLLTDSHYHGQMVLLLLVSLLVTFSLVFVFSMSDGIREKYVLLGGGDLLVDGEVEGGCVVRTAGALCYGKKGTVSLSVKGVDEEFFSSERRKEFTSLKGGMGESTLPKILISRSLAEEIGLAARDRCLLVLVKDESYKPVLTEVDGFYESGYREFDRSLVFVDSSLLEKYGYPARTEILSDDIEERRIELWREGYESEAWYERNNDIAQNLVTSRKVVMSVFLIIVLLSAYFVSDFSATLVSDRKREIALLRLLGMRKKEIGKAFLLSTLALSTLSLLAGLACGIALSFLALPLLHLLSSLDIASLSYYLLSFRVVIPWSNVFLILSSLLLFSTLSTLVVLARIRRVEPISLMG